MWYWVVMILLIAVAVGLVAAIFLTMKKNKRGYSDNRKRDRRREEQSRDRMREDQGRMRSREEQGRDQRDPRDARERRVAEEQTTVIPTPNAQSEPPRRPAKKQWKVLLENLETWEKFTYIFYDNIGLGRSKESLEFEKFLTIREDPRVSKVHCAIVRKGDKLYLRDLGSRNGTYLNGERITQPVVLQKDDIIGIGETKIELQKVLRERD